MRRINRDQRIENSLKTTHRGNTLFDDVYIEHNSLPDLNFEDIDTTVDFLGREISFPLLINAMTGGTEKGCEINESLYMLSKEFNIPMEVGSQSVAVEDKVCKDLFIGTDNSIDDQNAIVIANLNANDSMEHIKAAMDMVNAEVISLYINPAQELVTKGGERDFEGILENIRRAVEENPGKIMVKEVGFGMSEEVIKKLVDAGVEMINVSGYGGTNFVEIENLRNLEYDFSDLYDWGVPTAKSIINAREISDDIMVISSGGIKNSMDIVKSLILGADYVGISGELLKYLLHGGYDYARAYLEEIIYKTKMIMLLLGARNIEELKKTPYRITGRLKEII